MDAADLERRNVRVNSCAAGAEQTKNNSLSRILARFPMRDIVAARDRDVNTRNSRLEPVCTCMQTGACDRLQLLALLSKIH